jgi:hypothetical membrane protein
MTSIVTNLNKIQSRDLIGFLFYVGSLQFFLAVLIGEGMTSNYNSALHYVSSLGVGSTAFLFSFSVFILGLCLVISTYFLHKEYNQSLPTILLLLAGLSAIGVGIFPENVRPFHGIFTGLVFIFGALFLISSFKLNPTSFTYFISGLGVVILIFLFIFFPYLGLEVDSSTKFLGFFKGTLERFIIYSTLLSYLLLGGYLSR